MSLLSNLPASICRNILSTWLVDLDYAKLDVANCGSADRPTFLEMLAHTEIRDINTCCDDFTQKLQWMLTRKVKCSSFTYQMIGRLSPAEIAVLNDYFATKAADQKRVRLSNSQTATPILLRLMAEHALRLTTFTVHSFDRLSKVVPWGTEFGVILRNSAAVLVELVVQCRVPFRTLITVDIHFPVLRTIDITSEKEEDLIALCTAAPHLLNITFTNPVCSARALVAIAEHCTGLQSFTINCRAGYIVDNIDDGISAMAISCRKLKILRLKVCDNLTDIGLTAVATHCTQLQELIVTESTLITDAGLVTLAHSAAAKSLRHLGLMLCTDVVGSGVIAIVQHCPVLHKLDLEETEYSCVTAVIPHLRDLKELSLRNTEVDDTLLRQINEHMHSLECLSVAPKHEPAFTTVGLEYVVLQCSNLKTLRISYYDYKWSKIEAEGWTRPEPGLYQRIGTC